MKRRSALLALLALAAARKSALAQRQALIAVLSVGTAENSRRNVEQLIEGLRELGHAFGSSPLVAFQGGCLAYGPDLADISTRTAAHIDRILRGAKPAEIPVEEPRKFQLVVNLKTARAIGYATPPNMLARADLVIE